MVRLDLTILDKTSRVIIWELYLRIFKNKERIVIDMNTQWVSSSYKTRELQTHVCTLFFLVNCCVFSVPVVSLKDSILL